MLVLYSYIAFKTIKQYNTYHNIIFVHNKTYFFKLLLLLRKYMLQQGKLKKKNVFL